MCEYATKKFKFNLCAEHVRLSQEIYINSFVANERFLTGRRPGSNCETSNLDFSESKSKCDCGKIYLHSGLGFERDIIK